MRYGLVAAALLGVAAPAQDNQPESFIKKYAATVAMKDVTLSAEFRYRTAPAGRESLFLKNFVVVEVAVKGAARRRFELRPGMFSLRVNGRRSLAPTSAQMVASHLRWHDDRRQLEIGMGPGAVILGGPSPGPRFPGDPRRVPERPRAPETQPPRREEREPVEILRGAELPEGEVLLPVSGCLYFPYEKKSKSIRRLELIFRSAEGEATLRLK